MGNDTDLSAGQGDRLRSEIDRDFGVGRFFE